jgi:hypothetical protein
MIHIRRLNEMAEADQTLTPIQREVMAELKERYGIDTGNITWGSDNYFCNDADGCNGSVYKSEEEARRSILSPTGDNHQNALDFVEDAMGDEEWIGFLENCGINRRTAEKIISGGNWKKVVEIVVKNEGAKFFLSTYSGGTFELGNGYIVYF